MHQPEGSGLDCHWSRTALRDADRRRAARIAIGLVSPYETLTLGERPGLPLVSYRPARRWPEVSGRIATGLVSPCETLTLGERHGLPLVSYRPARRWPEASGLDCHWSRTARRDAEYFTRRRSTANEGISWNKTDELWNLFYLIVSDTVWYRTKRFLF